MMEEENKEEQIDLRDYLRVVLKRRWTIFTFFFIVVLTVAFHTFSAVPIYQASSRIIIEKENPNLVSVQEVMVVDASESDYYQTQYKIIESRTVAREVIRRLDLNNSPEFFPPPKDDLISEIKRWLQETVGNWISWIKNLIKVEEKESPQRSFRGVGTKSSFSDSLYDEIDTSPDSRLVSSFLNRARVSPIRNSRLVDVSIEASDPVLAARMANELVRTYIDQNLETKLSAAKDAVKWLNDRIDEERKKVEEAETAFLTYKREHQVITDFSENTESINAQKLANLNSRIVDAESVRVVAETRYKQAADLKNSPEMLDSIPDVLRNRLIQQIKKMEVDLYKDMSELSKKYGKNHPKMVALRSELADLNKRKNKEIKRIVNSLRNEYKLTLAKEESLKNAFSKQKADSLKDKKVAIEFRVLERQVESSRHLYELLIKRMKETTLTEEFTTGNIRVIDRAEVPLHPIKPNKKLNIILAVIVGLTIGIALAFFLEYLDNTIKLPDEIRSYLKIPFLGVIPAFAASESQDGIPGELITIHSQKSSASEAYRGIRTGILFSSAEHTPQVILVSSAGPEEGKTLSASNLAVTMAQSGSRVVLIDCDMRRPKIHNMFKVRRDNGISNILVRADDHKAAILTTPVKNLHVIPSGPIPPNPSEILSSKRMAELLDTLRNEYSQIIIDSPPLTAVTDSVVMAPMTDGVIIVIRAGDTPKQVVKNGLTQLKSVNANILGAVLNGVNTGRDSYYDYQYYYYYYGDDGNLKKSRDKSK